MSTITAPRPFDPEAVPPSGCDRLRWPIGFSPNGRAAPPASALTGVVNNLVLKRQEDAEPLTPARVTVELHKIVLDDDTGEYRLVPRPAISGTPTRAAFRPGSFSSLDVTGAEVLAEALVGGPALTRATDKQLWESTLAAAAQVGARGRSLRDLCDAVAILIALRCGLVVEARKIPWS